MFKLVLTSTSERRKEVLDSAGIPTIIEKAKVTQEYDPSWTPEEVALHLAERKAQYGFEIHPDKLVLGVFTVIVIDGEILNDPVDNEDAARMLRKLSGRTHKVISGVCLISEKGKRTFLSETDVEFGEVSEDEIEYYVNTGEAHDKAGAYTIRGFGSRYVKSVNGDVHNLLGIPLYQLYQELKHFDT